MTIDVALDLVEGHSTYVAHLHTTSTRHLVAAIKFNKSFVTFWTSSHFRFAKGLFNFEASLILALLFDNFLASEGNVGGFATFDTRTELTTRDWAVKNHLSVWYLSLVPTLWTHS